MSKEKLAEKLVILDDHAKGLKVRLYSLKKKFNNNRPSFLADASMKKLNDAFTKSFPELPNNIEKVPGYDLFKKSLKEIGEQTEICYATFLDVLDFKDAAFHFLADINSTVVSLKYDQNPHLSAGYMNLLVDYIKIHLLLASIIDRKVILSMYARCFFEHHKTTEGNFARLAFFLREYEQPFRRIQEEFQSLSSRVGDVLCSIQMSYMKMRDLSLMRREGILSIIQEPNLLTAPITDAFRLELTQYHQFHEWIIFGLLFCPNELAQASLVELMKFALQEGYVLNLFRDEVFHLHPEFETVFGWFKGTSVKLSQYKKLIPDLLISAVTKCGPNHRDRRLYLRQELGNMLHLFQDSPGLLGPKFQMALAALHIASSELQWYFDHYDRQPTKTKAKYKEEDFRDPWIPQLLYRCVKLHKLILEHRDLVSQYYLDYLTKTDKKALNMIISAIDNSGKMKDNDALKLIKAVYAEVDKITEDDLTKNTLLSAIRLNWMRAEAELSLAKAPVKLTNLKSLAVRMNMAYTHSLNIDRLEHILIENSLRSIFFYNQPVFNSFSQALQSDECAHYWVGYVEACDFMSDNAFKQLPNERVLYGKKAVELAQQLCNLASNAVCKSVLTIFDSFMELENQSAAHKAKVPRKAVTGKKKEKNVVEGGAKSVTAVLADDSDIKSSGRYKSLMVTEQLLGAICHAMNETKEIRVFDTIIRPIQFLHERMELLLRMQMKQIARFDAKTLTLQQPSFILHSFRTFFKVAHMVSNYVDVDTHEMLRVVLLENIGPSGSQGEGNLLAWCRHWYGTSIMKSFPSMKGCLFSDVACGFQGDIELTEGRPSPERFADLIEFKALAALLGPLGVRGLVGDLVKGVSGHVAELKKFLIENQHTLDDLKTNHSSTEKMNENLLKLKGLNEFFDNCMIIGNTLKARRLLRFANSLVSQERVPAVFDNLQHLHEHYPSNVYHDIEFLETDAQALDMGVDTSPVDVLLHACIKKLNATALDATLWGLLPVAFGVLFHHPAWKEAVYRVNAGAYSNNLQVLALTMTTLIQHMQALSSTNSTNSAELCSNDQLIKDGFYTFLDVASAYQLSLKENPKAHTRELPQLYVFFEQFYNECPEYVCWKDFEDRFPYALLRTAVVSLKTTTSSKEDNKAEEID
eukprot:GCRY01000996.1.p1 GENE.GCRY01000996.1~~GCRY01000996.1.p1  ORF type:complete len:1147 (-),score=394.86 GCRY01000996.1:283-3723(-)